MIAPMFCTAVNCNDGRTQRPLIEWLSKKLNVDHIDLVTEPGGVRVLALDPKSSEAQSIYRRIDVSIQAHNSHSIAIAAGAVASVILSRMMISSIN
jgi:hypothetical protein